MGELSMPRQICDAREVSLCQCRLCHSAYSSYKVDHRDVQLNCRHACHLLYEVLYPSFTENLAHVCDHASQDLDRVALSFFWSCLGPPHAHHFLPGVAWGFSFGGW